jgi:hypothetical protein
VEKRRNGYSNIKIIARVQTLSWCEVKVPWIRPSTVAVPITQGEVKEFQIFYFLFWVMPTLLLPNRLRLSGKFYRRYDSIIIVSWRILPALMCRKKRKLICASLCTLFHPQRSAYMWDGENRTGDSPFPFLSKENPVGENPYYRKL